MKLGDTRAEMQRNYTEFRKGSRKWGKVCVYIFLVISLLRFKGFLFSVIFALWGYAEGNILYFEWKRIDDWCVAMATDDNFMGTVLSVIVVPIMFSIGALVGIYDWIKIHIDAKRYGLRIE